MTGKLTFASRTWRAKTWASGTWAGVGVTPTTISVSPNAIQENQTGVVLTVTGVNTTWESDAPSFSFSGVAGLSITSTTVLSDTSATITVNSGSFYGTATLVDATTGASTPFYVVSPAPPVAILPDTSLKESDGERGGYLVPSEWYPKRPAALPLSQHPFGGADAESERKANRIRKRRHELSVLLAKMMFDDRDDE